MSDFAPPSLSADQISALLKPIASGRVAHANGQSHVEAWDVRRHLIRFFGFGGWDFTVTRCELIHDSFAPAKDKQGDEIAGKFSYTAVYLVIGRLTIRDEDGQTVATYEDGATGDGPNQKTVGDAHDMALKTAMSQALKRCAVNLGDQFGLSLYRNGSTDATVIRTLVGPPTVAVSE